MTEVDPDVREFLEQWAAIPSAPASQLTAEAAREDDLGVLGLQRAPGELHSVEDVATLGPAGMLPVRVYRPRRGRLYPVLFLHGGPGRRQLALAGIRPLVISVDPRVVSVEARGSWG